MDVQKSLTIEELLESNFDMVEKQEVRENLGWFVISDNWVILVG